MSNLAPLTEAIVKVVPEITFGCNECNGTGKEICDNPDHGFIDALSFNDIGRIGCPGCGHDEKHRVKSSTCYKCCNNISLADVLRTVATIGEINPFGGLTPMWQNEHEYFLKQILMLWNLSKPLHLQSPKVIEFLYQIICKK